MVASKKVGARRKKKVTSQVGLVAQGAAGGWDVTVDGSLEGVERWFLQIESPLVYVYLEIPFLVEIEQLVDFLRHTSRGRQLDSRLPHEIQSSFQLAKMDRTPITLLHDDESDGRIFFLFGAARKPVLRLTISTEDRLMLADALGQVRDDLRRDGLL